MLSHSQIKFVCKEVGVQSYQRIWRTVKQIPYAQVASYGQIADLAGLPGRSRLVSKALRQSPVELPWYRVVRSSGQIAFPAASAEAQEQRALLMAEGIQLRGNKVPAEHFWRPQLAELLFGLQD